MMSRKSVPKREQIYEVRKINCCVSDVGKISIPYRTVREREKKKTEREKLQAPSLSEITFPPCPKGQHQLSPKLYLNLHGLGDTSSSPMLGGTITL